MKSIFLLLILIISGCSTSFKLTPVVNKTDNQEIMYYDGNEIAISIGEETGVGIFGEKTEENEIKLFVIYQNNADKAINIDPAKISIEYLDYYNNRNNLKVYSTDEYIKKMKRDQAWQAFALGLQAFSDSYNAGRSSSTTTGQIGNIPFSANTNTYDASKVSEINRKNMDRIQQNVLLNNMINENTMKSLISKNTLFSNQIIAGVVMGKYKSSYKYIILIPAGKDIHKIEFIPSSPNY